MDNQRIYSDIRRLSSVTKTAKAIGCTPQSLRNKLGGVTPWKISEIIALSHFLRWTAEEFLTIIGYYNWEE